MNLQGTEKILRSKQVEEMLGISRVTLWRWERAGLVPPKRKVGPNVVGWFESEVMAWLADRPARSDLGDPRTLGGGE